MARWPRDANSMIALIHLALVACVQANIYVSVTDGYDGNDVGAKLEAVPDVAMQIVLAAAQPEVEHRVPTRD